MHEVYMFTWECYDEDGKLEQGLENITDNTDGYSAAEWTDQLASFLSQTNETYIDKWDVVHEIYQGKDQPFAYCFDVMDGDWQEIVGNMGERLDDSLNKDMPENIRQGFAEIYNHALVQVQREEAIRKMEEAEFRMESLIEDKALADLESENELEV